MFPEEICDTLFSINEDGEKHLDVFVEEQLAPESNVSVMPPLKKVKTPVFKTFNKKVKVKLKEKVVQVQSNCNFYAQLAIVASDRTIDMKDVIGHYELTLAIVASGTIEL